MAPKPLPVVRALRHETLPPCGPQERPVGPPVRVSGRRRAQDEHRRPLVYEQLLLGVLEKSRLHDLRKGRARTTLRYPIDLVEP